MQRIAAIILGIALSLRSLWMLRSFLAALVWAVRVIAVATAPQGACEPLAYEGTGVL